jgi:hypothetical protein
MPAPILRPTTSRHPPRSRQRLVCSPPCARALAFEEEGRPSYAPSVRPTATARTSRAHFKPCGTACWTNHPPSGARQLARRETPWSSRRGPYLRQRGPSVLRVEVSFLSPALDAHTASSRACLRLGRTGALPPRARATPLALDRVWPHREPTPSTSVPCRWPSSARARSWRVGAGLAALARHPCPVSKATGPDATAAHLRRRPTRYARHDQQPIAPEHSIMTTTTFTW